MKIVYVIEDFYIGGGVERIVSEKANILSSQYGHEVTLISIYRDEPRQSYYLNKSINLVFLDVPMADKHCNAIKKTINRFAVLAEATIKLNNAIRKIKPDVIFFATTLSALLLPLCRTNAKKIFESHSAKIFTPYNKLFFAMERCADAVVCLTNDDAREYHNARKTIVIPNFVDTPHCFVTDYHTKKAIAVGRLEHVKGFDILIDCWKNIANKHPDWQLDIYGEGSCRNHLQQKIDQNNLSNKVKLCGRCNNIMSKYSEYSLFLMTSRYEGQPMVLIESQVCGLPCVTFNFKYGASDIVKNNVNGILVEQSNTAAFCNAMDKMMSSEELRTSYGNEAKRTIHKFSKDIIMGKWIEVLAKL